MGVLQSSVWVAMGGIRIDEGLTQGYIALIA